MAAALSVTERRKRDADRKRRQRAARKKATASKKPHKAAAKKSAPRLATAKPTANGAATDEERPGYMTIAKGIGAFLEECRAASTGGGFARKPDAIRKSIELHQAKLATAPTAIAELKERAILRDLAAALERAGEDGDGMSQAKRLFVTYGAEWAATNSIPYAVFREMGVKPAALKEAGIPK